MSYHFILCIAVLAVTQLLAQPIDWQKITPDLIVPAITEGPPAAGQRVRQTTAGWKTTQAHHLLYLPPDWKPNTKLPVLIEYAGNGPFKNTLGDSSDGTVESCLLGYGISAGKGFIWACLPFIEGAHGTQRNALKWWGDLQESKNYTLKTVADLCLRFGGDPDRVILCGFSRGSIGCNFIGLHDDEIAKLWCGFVCHSHYDGVRAWPYAEADQVSAITRLRRLGNRPQWISHEITTAATEAWLKSTAIQGNWTFTSMPFPNHSTAWVLRDLPERQKLREWVKKTLSPITASQ
jgi:hypothetical protein